MNTCPTCDCPSGAPQLHFVTEITPKSPFLRVVVNTSPIRYGFRPGAKGIRYSVSINLTKPGEDKNVALRHGHNKPPVLTIPMV